MYTDKLDFTNKKVLVTGGAGFIGSHIVLHLIELGASVIALDDLSFGQESNIPKNNKVEFVKDSVTNKKTINKLVSQVSLIFHQAARNIVVSTKDPYNDFEVNIKGTLNLNMACKKHGIEKLVYASSASIYGNPGYLPIKEDEPANTLSPYSVSKLAGENYCRAFYETYGIPTVCLRYSNVFGPGQLPGNPWSGVISKFINAALNNQPLTIHGDGCQTRDFTYIDDVVEATLSAALSPQAIGSIFNVASGVETSILQLAEAIKKILGKEIVIEKIDRRDIDNIRRRVLNIERIHSKLRWQPKFSIEEGLRKTIKWFKEGQIPLAY
jgi:UDP-glucose 4-epimerase